jgi:hypothetical protein
VFRQEVIVFHGQTDEPKRWQEFKNLAVPFTVELKPGSGKSL